MKVLGRDYMRIIYSLDYELPENIPLSREACISEQSISAGLPERTVFSSAMMAKVGDAARVSPSAIPGAASFPMDPLITAAALALAAGDLLGVLKRVGLRSDAPALALRGIAMAQLGDFVRAKALLRSAGRAFGAKEAISRARCVVAEAEIALVTRDLNWPPKALEAARATLEKSGDWVNAAHARHLQVRRLLVVGRLDEAERALAAIDPAPFPPRRGPPRNWSLRVWLCGGFGPAWRALRSPGPSAPRARPASPP